MQRHSQSHSASQLVTRLLIGAGLIGSLISCGGGTSAAADTNPGAASTAAESVQNAAAVAPAPAAAADASAAAGTQAAGTPDARAPGFDATVTSTAWTHCGWEGETCKVSGTQQVRYGANGSYFYKSVTNAIACANTTWGDPMSGIRKSCDVATYSTTTPPTTTPPPTATPAPAPTTTGTVQPIPTNVANGATVSLQCGVTYQGTLELNGKSNVTVKTTGTCGKASISPGRAITGWVKGTGNIYSAPISFAPVQVAVGGALVSAAHWPNQPWATSTSGMPSTDLTGANMVFLSNQSVIQSQVLTSNSVSTAKPFYVEGKMWMLDAPGEWAVSNGRLYMWAPDGSNPEGKVWASANGNGVNADNSSGITIDGIKIFSATDGVSGNSSTNLKVLNTDITNSARDGIWASGSKGLQVNLSSIANSRRNGIDGWYSVNGAKITNSSVSNTGMSGMPTATDAAIMFGDGGTNTIDNVKVTNSGYHGISMLHNRNSTLKNSVIDIACARLTDCAAVYTGARDQLPLTLVIDNNTVTNAKGTEGIGIYLDDFANGVTVNNNRVSNNTRGLVLHNAFNNVITNNTFASNAITHVTLGQDSGNIRNNKMTNNKFNSTNGEQNYNMETGSNLKTFISADYNTYTSSNVNEFHRYWDGKSAGVTQSYTAWKGWSGQDAHSTMNGR
jgi:parallel beta-helix repeat protein